MIVTATLLGAGTMTLAAGFTAHRIRARTLLPADSLVTAGAGIALAELTDLWPLIVRDGMKIVYELLLGMFRAVKTPEVQ